MYYRVITLLTASSTLNPLITERKKWRLWEFYSKYCVTDDPG